ncbi:MAG: type II toxin-antitoxin system VapC family toxin [Kiritimatiellia bacterium]
MKFLLDTHAFLWWIGNDDQLSDTARAAIADPDNEVFFSVVSAWEMAIKIRSGKLLSIPTTLTAFLQKHLRKNALSVMPISLEHSLQITELPPLHRDPFDRMLVAQAQVEKLQLITRDPEIAKYAVNICW